MRVVIIAAAFFVVSTSVVILAILPYLVTGSLINNPISFATTHEPETFGVKVQDLTLTTADELTLQAWEVAVEDPKAVVIMLGGLSNPSVTAFWGHARLFAEHGYASFLLEMRAHGASEGAQVGLGYEEHLDVLAALTYLQEQQSYEDVPVVVFGVDLGGVAAINAVGLYPELGGLISIGAFSSWAGLFTDNLYFSGTPLCIALLEKPFVKLYTIAKFGWSQRHIFPKKQIANLGHRPALLMHSREDEQVSLLNLERLQLSAPSHAEFWVRDGAEHLVCTDFLYPEEDPVYTQRILRFLEDNFTKQPLSQ